MNGDALDVEALLRRALAPVEPPQQMAQRFEDKLQSLTDAAVDELEGWELSAMRDPRNWVRPVVAARVGVTAGTALVALRVHAVQKKRNAASSKNPADIARRTAASAAAEAQKLLRRG